jgi:hypothetical protein
MPSKVPESSEGFPALACNPAQRVRQDDRRGRQIGGAKQLGSPFCDCRDRV